MKKTILITVIGLLSMHLCRAQSSQVDSLIDEIMMFEEDEIAGFINPRDNFHFVYARTNYNNKTFYAGREIGSKLYNLSGQLYYFNSKGLFVGAGGSWYSDFDPNYSSTVLTAGLSKSLKTHKKLRYRISYSRFFYHIPDFDPTYNGSLSVGTTIKHKWAGARLDASLLSGDEWAKNISFDVFSKFKIAQLGSRFNKIQIEPEINFYLGTETVETEANSFISEGMRAVAPIYTTIETEQFGLMNTQLLLPVSLFYKDLDIEVTAGYNIPRSLDPNYSYQNSFFFNVSLGYIFGLN